MCSSDLVEATTPGDPALSLPKAVRALPRTGDPLPCVTRALSQVAQAAGGLDLSLVTPIYSSALTSFLTRRNSPLTVTMFLSLFSRHPVSIGAGPPPGPLLSPGPTSPACHFLHRCCVRACCPS